VTTTEAYILGGSSWRAGLKNELCIMRRTKSRKTEKHELSCSLKLTGRHYPLFLRWALALCEGGRVNSLQRSLRPVGCLLLLLLPVSCELRGGDQWEPAFVRKALAISCCCMAALAGSPLDYLDSLTRGQHRTLLTQVIGPES
jgi:hypothetical protein